MIRFPRHSWYLCLDRNGSPPEPRMYSLFTPRLSSSSAMNLLDRISESWYTPFSNGSSETLRPE